MYISFYKKSKTSWKAYEIYNNNVNSQSQSSCNMYCLFIQNFEEKQNVFYIKVLKNVRNKKALQYVVLSLILFS